MAESQIRSYSVKARSTDTFGRVLCNARDQHLVVDGPVQNGCPGEALGPAELFLAGVAGCGVELPCRWINVARSSPGRPV